MLAYRNNQIDYYQLTTEINKQYTELTLLLVLEGSLSASSSGISIK